MTLMAQDIGSTFADRRLGEDAAVTLRGGLSGAVAVLKRRVFWFVIRVHGQAHAETDLYVQPKIREMIGGSAIGG